MEICIYGPNGEEHRLTAQEASFLQPSLSLKYIASAAPIVLRLAARLSLRPLFILSKGGIRLVRRRMGYGGPLLNMEGMRILDREIFGFSPLFLEAKQPGIRISLAKNSTGVIILYLMSIVFKNDHNISPSMIKNRNVLDAGANIGVFAVYSAKLGARKVYAFEPVAETYEILKENIKLNKMENVVVPVNMALGDRKGTSTIHFDEACEGTASLLLDGLKSPSGKKRSQKVKVTTVDSFMEGRGKTAFIKMDVEGYEENVLLGARKTIGKCKPILSFSAYHKKDDKKRLPEVVREIRKDYSIRLIHGSEDVFFCD